MKRGKGTRPVQKVEWSFDKGMDLFLGVEKAARLLIEEMDNRLADRETIGTVAPDTKGMAVVCIMACAYFCEIALKTLHSSLNEGVSPKEHDLELLYREVESAYSTGFRESPQQLEDEILAEMKAYYTDIPDHWVPSSIRGVLEAGSDNFTDWGYIFPECNEATAPAGLPRQLFGIAVGIYLVCLKQNPRVWGEPGQNYLLPNPDGNGFSVIEVK